VSVFNPSLSSICFYFVLNYFSLNKKWAPYILMLLMLIAIVVIRQCKSSNKPLPKPTVTNNDKPKDPASNPSSRDRGFDRRTSYLEYSNHAKCRMQCRKISQAEVEEIMRDGTINYAKSDIKNSRCPRYAVEGRTSDNQRVRIVYAQCNESTMVVTVIDLETDFECHCPGDDDKYKNRN
jgi:uncharacterized DUF497 family protein